MPPLHKVISAIKDGGRQISPPATWTPPSEEVAERLRRAGCIREFKPGESKTAAADGARVTIVVPTVEELTAAGLDEAEASGMVEAGRAFSVAAAAIREGKSREEIERVFHEMAPRHLWEDPETETETDTTPDPETDSTDTDPSDEPSPDIGDAGAPSDEPPPPPTGQPGAAEDPPGEPSHTAERDAAPPEDKPAKPAKPAKGTRKNRRK